MDKDTSEIAKLTERISKDPKSKLFVPLAEEYKKAGDIEMSILVLQEGLKNNPGYITARSFLGRLLIEQGDLPGARKEFEEVVKAIPDNLMAQRKLGDIYALQDRPTDALVHFKTALSLNPKDAETAMLIAEVEAGRDIKKHLAKPKTAAAEEPLKKHPQPVSIQPAAKPQLHTAPGIARQPGPGQSPMAQNVEEEPEEVLTVEPLEPPSFAAAHAGLDQESASKNLDFLAEPLHEPASSTAEDAKGDALFDLNDPFAIGGDAGAALEEPVPPIGGRKGTGPGTAKEPEKQADDFTTDTLAELYISQGFFEKAVDIYERMLVDNPASRGLKDKLAHVRAMAAAAPAEETQSEAVPFTIREELPETGAAEKASELDSFVAPEGGAAQPRLDDWELPATKAIPGIDEDVPPAVHAPLPPRRFEVGFEPREYVPPGTVSRQAENTVKGSADHGGDHEPLKQTGKSAAARKQTVERLESWLKNIIKES